MNLKLLIFYISILMIANIGYADTKVIAHQGYWKTPGSATNSISSYKNADALNIYGSEIDVWISSDDVVYVNHDHVIKGCEIQKSTSKECNKIRLANGEKMPTLKNYLKAVKKGHIQLVCEIKSHKDPKREQACVREVLRLVKKAGLEKRTDYIAFSWNVCLQLVKEAPAGTEIYYLSGNKSPQEIKKAGLTGPDYHYKVMIEKHPEWLQQFKDLGMKINIWTIDDEKTMKYYIEKGVDFITTNEPVLCKELTK